MHVDACGWLLNVPGEQSLGVSEPTAQNVPSGHTTQSDSLTITSSELFLCVPPGHGSGADAPAGQ